MTTCGPGLAAQVSGTFYQHLAPHTTCQKAGGEQKGHNNYNRDSQSTSSVCGWNKHFAYICLFKPHTVSQGGDLFTEQCLRLTAETKGQGQDLVAL